MLRLNFMSIRDSLVRVGVGELPYTYVKVSMKYLASKLGQLDIESTYSLGGITFMMDEMLSVSYLRCNYVTETGHF